jgi:glycine cleavage system H protein
MADRRYAESHEWCSLEGDVATVGISKHAAEELGDLTFLDYRVEAGGAVAKGDTIGEIDSVKATSEIYAPVAGTVEAINERFQNEDELAAISGDPEGADAWLVKIKVADAAEVEALMDAAAYEAFCAKQ